MLRVAQRSPGLINFKLSKHAYRSDSVTVTLADLVTVPGLARALRSVSQLQLESQSAPVQLQALQQCTGLVHLSLHMFSAVGVDNEFALAAALQSMPSLTHLEAGMACLSCESVAALFSALRTLKKLVHLTISGTFLEGCERRELVPMLASMSGLRTLHAHYQMRVQEPAALAAVLLQLPRLTCLDVGGAYAGPHGAAILVPVLRQMTCLQHLQFNCSGLRGEGVARLT